MKNDTQVFVTNSFEAARVYCDVFGAQRPVRFSRRTAWLMSTAS